MVQDVRSLKMRKRLQQVIRDCCREEVVRSLVLCQSGCGFLELTVQFGPGIDVVDERDPWRGFAAIGSCRQRLGLEDGTVSLSIAGCGTRDFSEFRRAIRVTGNGFLSEEDGVFQLTNPGGQIFEPAPVDISGVNSGTSQTQINTRSATPLEMDVRDPQDTGLLVKAPSGRSPH